MQVTENAKTILEKRYLQSNEDGSITETPDEMLRRVARTAASCEKKASEWEERYHEMLDSTQFLPNTPCLINAGKPDGMLFACFLLPVEDNMEGIFDSVKNGALIHKNGGGTGYNFSSLRPEGTSVQSTKKVASGPVSFMRVFDAATEIIKQGGVRRGANMGVLNIDHADILDFIHCKSEDGQISNFNISVGMLDSFMRNPDPEIWNDLIDCAWKTGDPGLLFLDTINAGNLLLDHLGMIEGTNPCQPGWATVLTPDGIRRLDSVGVGDTIWSGSTWTTITKKVATGTKQVNAYRTRAGTFYGTSEHRVVQHGAKTEIRHADCIDLAQGPVPPSRSHVLQAIVDGLVVGDGMMHKASNNRVLLCIGSNDQDYHTSEISDYILRERDGIKPGAWDIHTTILALPKTYERTVPNQYKYGDALDVASFLRGLYSANGSVVDNRITLKSSSSMLIEDVQFMLSSIGISSYYTTNKSHDVEFRNGIYTCRESYDLNISSTGRMLFRDMIGFLQTHKCEKLDQICLTETKTPKTTYDIVEIEELGEEPVFDITVDCPAHTYWSGGLLISNCGEVPLYPYEACVLGSIDVSKIHMGRAVNWDELGKTVKLGVRFLDALIDVSGYPIPEIKKMVHANRRIGLGPMGWADLLIKARIHYDSQEALKLASRIMKFMNETAAAYSLELGKEKGVFPNHKYCKSLPGVENKPYRNIARTTIAPTGTLSILANCSSGIEPVFDIEFDKNIADTKLEERSDFYKDNRKWIHTTNEIDVYWHVATQAAFQEHVGNAVSKCIAKGSLVQTTKGVFPIEELGTVTEPDSFGPPIDDVEVVDLDGNRQRITSIYYGGKLPTKKIRLSNGTTLEGTHNHRVMTLDGWKKLHELTVNELVCCRTYAHYSDSINGGEELEKPGEPVTNASHIIVPAHMNEKLAMLLGMLAADGSTCEPTGVVALTTTDNTVEAIFSNLCYELFSVHPRQSNDVQTSSTRSMIVTSRRLVRWIEHLIGKGYENKHVPVQILRGSRAEQLAFLRGVTLNGYIRYTPAVQTSLVIYEGHSKDLADQIHAICFQLGLPSYYYSIKGSIEESYSVAVDTGNIEPIELHKRLHLVRKCRLVRVPARVYELTLHAHDRGYDNLRYIHENAPAVVQDSILDELHVPYDTSEFFCKVTHITDSEAEVYDIEVENTHSYVVNGIISHNTINLPNEATRDDVAEAYQLAWKMKCKGITIYRDGCRQNQPWTRVKKIRSDGYMHPRSRPDHLEGKTVRVRTEDGNMYVTINHDEYGPFETFITLGETDNRTVVLTDAVARMISLNLRSGVSPEEVMKHLRKIRALDGSGHRFQAIPIAIADVIESAIFPPAVSSCSIDGGPCTECET